MIRVLKETAGVVKLTTACRGLGQVAPCRCYAALASACSAVPS